MRSDATIYRWGTVQTITTSGASARTAAGVGAQTYAVRIHATAAAHIVFGDDSVDATTSDTLLPAGGTEYVQVTPGQSVAAIQESSAGTVYVTELTH